MPLLRETACLAGLAAAWVWGEISLRVRASFLFHLRSFNPNGGIGHWLATAISGGDDNRPRIGAGVAKDELDVLQHEPGAQRDGRCRREIVNVRGG